MFRTIAVLMFLPLLLTVARPQADPAGAKASSVPAIKVDATRALASQWMNAAPAGKQPGWVLCLIALDLATQAQPNYSDALTVLGYDGTPTPKYPYPVPPGDADLFWDWLAGASRSSDDRKPDKPITPSDALNEAKILVDQYYKGDNRALMEKVDANFSAKNPRRAIFELLSYGAKDLAKAMADAQAKAVAARAEAAEKAGELDQAKKLAAIMMDVANKQVDALKAALANSSDQGMAKVRDALDAARQSVKKGSSGNKAVDDAAEQLANDGAAATVTSAGTLKAFADSQSQTAKSEIKKAIDYYVTSASNAASAAATDSAKKAAELASAGTCTTGSETLCVLEKIRFCYASDYVDPKDPNAKNCLQQLSDHVAKKFRTLSK